MVATLAVVAVLSLLVVLISRVLRTDQEYILMREARLEALSWAEAGLALASHPSVKRGDPALEWDSGSGAGYKVYISSEDARLNPNVVIQRGDTQLLRDLFQYWGLDLDTASAVIGAMEDCVDEDDMESLNGAEADAYSELGLPGVPPNRPFQTVREMTFVIGAETLDTVRPGWETLFSTRASGTIDLFDAPAELITVACGVSLEQAQRFVELRWGDDMLPETEDDPPMTSVTIQLMPHLPGRSSHRRPRVRGRRGEARSQAGASPTLASRQVPTAAPCRPSAGCRPAGCRRRSCRASRRGPPRSRRRHPCRRADRR